MTPICTVPSRYSALTHSYSHTHAHPHPHTPHTQYKDELTPDDAAALEAYLGKLAESEKNDLVGVMKSYITQQLVEETTAAGASFAGTLGYNEIDDNYLFDLTVSWKGGGGERRGGG